MDYTETWKPIPGFEGRYDISDHGRVRSHAYGRITLRAVVEYKHHYMRIMLRNHLGPKLYAVHRLVLLAFVGPCPPAHEVNHLDGERRNNRLANLEYATKSQNNKHAYDCLGKVPQRGSQHGRSKLTESDVLEIRRLSRAGLSLSQLADRFDSKPANLSFILNRRTWKHVP